MDMFLLWLLFYRLCESFCFFVFFFMHLFLFFWLWRIAYFFFQMSDPLLYHAVHGARRRANIVYDVHELESYFCIPLSLLYREVARNPRGNEWPKHHHAELSSRAMPSTEYSSLRRQRAELAHPRVRPGSYWGEIPRGTFSGGIQVDGTRQEGVSQRTRDGRSTGWISIDGVSKNRVDKDSSESRASVKEQHTRSNPHWLIRKRTRGAASSRGLFWCVLQHPFRWRSPMDAFFLGNWYWSRECQ
jgi:hypothetical protein